MNHKIVVIGAGYAGLVSALRLAGKTRDADITLINASDHFVERIRLHQHVTGQALKSRPIAALLRGKRVRFVRGFVTQIDLKQHTVVVDSQAQPINYETLVYALGSVTETKSIPGVREHAFAVESPQLREKLAALAKSGGRLLVVGGGLTGIESASEIADAFPNVQVTLATRGVFGSEFSQKGQHHLRRTFDKLGIGVRDNTTITQVHAHIAVTNAQDEIPFDVCLWTGSFVATSLARETGLTVNAQGQILVDLYLRSISHPEVYAVGDAAAIVERPGAPIRMACAIAVPMGAQAADNVVAQINHTSPAPFSYAHFARGVSLGRYESLIQWVKPDDTPRDSITTGRLAVFIKEAVSKIAVFSMSMERLYAGSTVWMKWPAGVKTSYVIEH